MYRRVDVLIDVSCGVRCVDRAEKGLIYKDLMCWGTLKVDFTNLKFQTKIWVQGIAERQAFCADPQSILD